MSRVDIYCKYTIHIYSTYTARCDQLLFIYFKAPTSQSCLGQQLSSLSMHYVQCIGYNYVYGISAINVNR